MYLCTVFSQWYRPPTDKSPSELVPHKLPEKGQRILVSAPHGYQALTYREWHPIDQSLKAGASIAGWFRGDWHEIPREVTFLLGDRWTEVPSHFSDEEVDQFLTNPKDGIRP